MSGTASASPSPTSGPDPRDLLQKLEGSMRTETRHILTLRGLLAEQRDAVAADDLVALDGAVRSTQRVLHTLTEARKARVRWLATLDVPGGTSLARLEGHLPPKVAEAIRPTLRALLEAAGTLQRELRVSGAVLDRVRAATAREIELIERAGENAVVYDRAGRGPGDSGRLINREV